VKEPKAESRKARKYSNDDLPNGCQDGGVWRRNMVPTYAQFVASYEDPWVVQDDNAVAAMQVAWDAIYGRRVRHTIEVQDAVFTIVGFFVYKS